MFLWVKRLAAVALMTCDVIITCGGEKWAYDFRYIRQRCVTIWEVA